MRDIYYQSVGNPLQLDRLPATRPAIEMLPPAASATVILSQVSAAFMAITGAALITLIVYRPPGLPWLEPYDFLLGIPILLAGIAACLVTARMEWLLHPVFLAALIFVGVNQRIPWNLQVVAISATVGFLVYSFGWHWIVLCTASPTPRQTAATARTIWRRELAVVAVIAAVLTAVLLWSGAVILKFALLLLPLAAMTMPSPEGLRRSRWQVLYDSIISWFTYDARPFPGLLQSPIAPAGHRRALLVFAAVLITVAMLRWSDSPLPKLVESARSHHQAIAQQLDARGAGSFERLRYAVATWGLTAILILAIPVATPLLLATSFTMPVLLIAAAQRDAAESTQGIETILADLRRSPDLRERHSVYLGQVVADGSPVLVPRNVFSEHAHALGDSGSGKTALFLCPVTEQLGMTGECSILALNFKADTLELLASLEFIADFLRREMGLRVPLKAFSDQVGMPTHAFNPMDQPSWPNFDLRTRADILCGAIGLTYGTDYGQGYYSSANAAVLYHALVNFPDVRTFVELADNIGNVIATAKKRELHPEIRKAGVHVHEVVKRLADCEPLNVTESGPYDEDVIEQAIDLSRVFQEPQLIYFHLSATLSPAGAPERGRLLTYMLLAAATQVKRKHPVFLVIDEFQRMVAANLEYMLQLARSMGVGIILANQAMEDLKKSTTNLIPAIEANCRVRQWYSVSSSDDQQRLISSGGLTVDTSLSRSVSTNDDGKKTVSYSETEKVVPRITINDILLTNDHPFRSFLQIKRSEGYAQYGGLPVIIESRFHISEEEYRRRQSMPWPDEPGMFVPDNTIRKPTGGHPPVSPGIVSTEEVINSGSNRKLSKAEEESIQRMFEDYRESMSPEQKHDRRPRQ